MPVPIVVVDAFTGTAFAGNPAAVCLLDTAGDPGWMQAVAAEMNLPMTAFVEPCADGFNLRWFMPRGEENLCGHATVAAAHVLWETGRLAATCPARFHTRSGLLTATLDGGWVELDLPAEPVQPAGPMPGLAGLGADLVFVGRNHRDVLVEVASERVVQELDPDLALLATVGGRGVIVTSPASGDGPEYVLRFFASDVVGGEDPVTGSAQCSLGPYWAERLGSDRLVARQLSRRGGLLRVHHQKDRVRVAGQAVTVLEGTLLHEEIRQQSSRPEVVRSEPVLRPARPSEANEITALTLRSKGYWAYDPEVLDGMRPMLTMNPDQIRDDRVVVAEQDGMLLGYYRLGGEPPDGELVDLFIEPRVIGTGLGRRLWKHAVASALKRGFQTLSLESDPNAEPFYLRMGAERIGEREVTPGRVLPVMRARLIGDD